MLVCAEKSTENQLAIEKSNTSHYNTLQDDTQRGFLTDCAKTPVNQRFSRYDTQRKSKLHDITKNIVDNLKKYENFCVSLENMKDIYNYEEPYDNVVLTGLVGLYEITFEQSWKMMKEILEIHGFAEGATSSPKMILRTAYKAGMIKDEELWLSALQERNNVTHSYNRKIAMGIITQAKQKFYKMFCELKEEIDRNWI